MRISLLLLLFTSPALLASDALVEPVLRPGGTVAAPAGHSAGRWWKASLVSLAAANALDVHSSWGKRETNHILAGQDGSFGAKGALIKLGLQGTVVGVQWLVSRRRPRAATYRYLTLLNLGASGTIGTTAIRNYGVPRPPR